MSKLIVQLVTWNGAKYVHHLFHSLREQTLQDWDLIIIDNGSSDGTIKALERELASFDRPLRFIRNNANRGFASGHNQAFRELGITNQESRGSECVQLLNQDVVLTPDYLERVLAFMEQTPECGAAQGALLRWDFAKVGKSDGGRTNIIDTLGLRVLRNRRVVELHTGEQLADCGLQLAAPFEVFGVSGALPMYRTAALRDVALHGSGVAGQGSGDWHSTSRLTTHDSRLEVFDEDFFSYKEDVDLAFRLRSREWRAFVVPAARAWHDRTAAGPRSLSDYAAIDSHRTKSVFIRYHSYKNQLFMLIKNERAVNFARDWPWICWYELKKLAYILLFDRATLRALREVWWQRHAMLGKRAQIMARTSVAPALLRRWYA